MTRWSTNQGCKQSQFASDTAWRFLRHSVARLDRSPRRRLLAIHSLVLGRDPLHDTGISPTMRPHIAHLAKLCLGLSPDRSLVPRGFSIRPYTPLLNSKLAHAFRPLHGRGIPIKRLDLASNTHSTTRSLRGAPATFGQPGTTISFADRRFKPAPGSQLRHGDNWALFWRYMRPGRAHFASGWCA